MSFFATVLLLFFVFLVGVVLPRIDFKYQHWIGYGLPALVIAYGIYDAKTCDDKFCEFLGVFLVLFSVIFVLGYAFSHGLSKLNRDTQLIAVLLFVITMLLIMAKPVYDWYQLYALEKELSALTEEAGQANSTKESIDICKDLNDRVFQNIDMISKSNTQKYRLFTDRLPGRCWMQAHINHKHQDLCLKLDKRDRNYEHCVAGQRSSLRGACDIDFVYEEFTDYQSHRKCLVDERDHPTACLPEQEYKKLVQCWDDISDTYISLDISAICYTTTLSAYRPYCINHFDR